MKLEILQANITTLEVDAVVNAANSLGQMGGGVAGALRRAGGEVIEREAMAAAPIALGEAVVTTGGKLPARHVIHAPTMEYPGMATSVEKVRLAARAALEAGEREGLATLALPGLGTGVGGLGVDEAAGAILGEIGNHSFGSLQTILLVDRSQEMVEAFRKASRP